MTVYNECVSQREQSKTNSRLRDWTLKTDSEIAIGGSTASDSERFALLNIMPRKCHISVV